MIELYWWNYYKTLADMSQSPFSVSSKGSSPPLRYTHPSSLAHFDFNFPKLRPSSCWNFPSLPPPLQRVGDRGAKVKATPESPRYVIQNLKTMKETGKCGGACQFNVKHWLYQNGADFFFFFNCSWTNSLQRGSHREEEGWLITRGDL